MKGKAGPFQGGMELLHTQNLTGEMQKLGKWISSLCTSPGDKKWQEVESRWSLKSLLTQTILGFHDHPTPFSELDLPPRALLRCAGTV